ncbi:MAG: hypothetical protein WC091_08225 [Sulfuricellaceae bacterium]
MKDSSESVADIPAEEVRAACDKILASCMFNKAPRMRRLLRFLIELAISGNPDNASEQVIGIGVFDRNAALYNTNEDPVVRVQVGRLRTKLDTYYATLGADADIEITLPLGSYMPIIRRLQAVSSNIRQLPQFEIPPFQCVSHHENGEELTNGLHNELVHQLFREFGTIAIVHSFSSPDDTASRVGINHRIEGCVQIDAERIRTSIRVVETATGSIAWSEQFSRNISHIFELQEELASSICGAMRRFLSA